MTIDLKNLPPIRAFGVWDAPATDDAEWIAVPTDLSCMHCQQQFVEGDNGAVMPTGFAHHRECALRMAMSGIGHIVDHAYFCGQMGDADAGLGVRRSAQLVWEVFNGERTLTRDGLIALANR